MKLKSIILIVVIVAILCGGGCVGCSQYNGMVTSEQEVDKTWADVQNQYQRRFDLIPNLVETVKGYAAHEKETFENVTMARAGLTDAYNKADSLKDVANPSDMASMEKYNNSQAQLNRAFNIYVNAVHEAYPDLKANEQFLSLQDQLEGTENRISTYRGYYNEAVKNFNLKVKRFPGTIFAGLFGFTEKTPFAADEQAQSAPKVQF